MKARIPVSDELKKAVREEVEKQYREREAEQFRRFLKLTGAALHGKRFGFGHDRIADFYGMITELSERRDQDEIFWKHIDDLMIDQLKLPFERENYEELDG